MNFKTDLLAGAVRITSFDRSPDQFALRFSLVGSDGIFQEHFENHPVLPGAYTLALVERVARMHWPDEAKKLRAFTQVIFVKPLRPETELCASFEITRQISNETMRSIVSYRIADASNRLHSQGAIEFENQGGLHE